MVSFYTNLTQGEKMEGIRIFFDGNKKSVFLLLGLIISIYSIFELPVESILGVLKIILYSVIIFAVFCIGRFIIKAEKEILSDKKNAKEKGTEESNNKNLILFNTIKSKNMYYNERENESIRKLISLLSEENYREIRKRLDERKMRNGFTCLFIGGPGTGKTETAYQIARQTGRNIMAVNIAETKSMWFGESERKIKEIFDTYREAVNNSKIIPILLFNEADGVIGKRLELNSSSRAIDQAENGIQNIILQEIENLTGILIATTNLAQNMDKAFERRFLYRINFDRPGEQGRKSIWNTLLPELPVELVTDLSGKFDLSGGQIENIARKINIDTILTGCVTKDTMMQYCKDEIQSSFIAPKRIGFETLEIADIKLKAS
jgi:SpoVK/Ycf46/Vps4 family AAA+-type ATPase